MTPDLIVVVPGIMGSVLSSGGTEVWNTSLRTVAHDLRRFDEFTRVLRLPDGVCDAAPRPGTEGALTVVGLIGGWNVWPGKWIGSGYHNTVERLRGRYQGRGQVAEFAYDWRLSIRHNAAELGRFVEQKLGLWRRQSRNPEARAVLYCHSMGGLLAAVLVNHLGGGGLVSRVVTLGTPYSGSVKALRYLAGGDPLVPDGVTDTLRTFPSLAQLLPTFRCVREQQEMRLIGAAGLPGISSQMIQDAIALREQSAWPAPGSPAAADRPPLHVFGGHRHGTLASVRVTFEALEYHDTWLDFDSGVDDRPVERNLRGDGTVPRFAAVPHNWTSDTSAIFRSQVHGRLPDHPVIRELVYDRLEGLDPRGFLDAELEVGLDLPGLAEAGVPIPVRATTSVEDSPGTQPIRLVAAVTDLRERPLDPPVALRPDGAGAYHAELRLPPGTWHVHVGRPGTELRTHAGDVIVVCESSGRTASP
jgi:hypothetical protein